MGGGIGRILVTWKVSKEVWKEDDHAGEAEDDEEDQENWKRQGGIDEEDESKAGCLQGWIAGFRIERPHVADHKQGKCHHPERVFRVLYPTRLFIHTHARPSADV